ncbi:MAG: hypothetical protein IKK04_06740 [Bacteroidales bacterium]|nr:hypothetical protein [Bacteroidales bacterium]
MGYNWQKQMKRNGLMIMCLISFLLIGATSSAQTRTKISEGLYLVDYAGTYVVEDEVNQRSISITITEEIKDRQTNEKIYKVTCGKWTRRTVKDALDKTIEAGIITAVPTKGTSLIISAAAKLAKYIYDDYCEYLEKQRR